jgi:hypothetical protein
MNTQTQYPWRTTVRTVVQVVLALATLIPVLIATGGLSAVAGSAQVVAVCAAITRIMALPQVEAFLSVYVPWLAAEGSA